MPEETNKDYGKLLLSWEFPEFEQHQKTKSWYIWALIISGVLLIWAIATANFLFALIIIMVAAIVAISTVKKPAPMDFKIFEDGIFIGEKYYDYKKLKSFWLVYNPPEVKKLYLEFKTSIRPEISIPLKDTNPLKVRKILLEYLDEDLTKEDESTSDQIQRLLKL